MPSFPRSPRQVVDLARTVAARVRPGPKVGTRSLPIRGAPDEVERLWSAQRKAILDGIPASSATLRQGADQGEWGTTWTVELELDAPMPGVATQALAGKAVRRLKALAETGEMPTTEHNPAFRSSSSEQAA